MLSTALATLVIAAQGAADPRPTVDSIMVTLPTTKVEALERVVSAFVEGGINVTRAEGGVVESDQGDLTAAFSSRIRRIRAVVFSPDSGHSKVLITAIESNGPEGKQRRVTSASGGNGRRVWCRMVRVARILDPTVESVECGSQAATPPAVR